MYDEMDQWVSDSFYSYFPGFTDEYQKRQDYLRNPQHENQQNLLRHQKLQISLTKPPADVSTLSPRNQIDSSLNNTYSQSSINLSSQSASIPNSKNDLEIIVTNPNYQPSKYIFSRPNTNRHKKLENLRHTALSSTEDVYTNRYKRSESEETYLNPSDQREHSFYVLEVTPTTLENHRADCIKSAFNSMDHEKYSGCHHVKTDFHTLSKSEKSFENIDKSFYFGNDENVSIDNVRRTVDKKLYQYLKNYNEEERNKNESRHRGTQSNNENMNRRDIMLHEEHNLSIPLLQEMPKMTRLEYINYAKLSTKQRKRKLDCLEQKCQLIFQIPDIQTCNMTQNLPLMVTQVGAIRKQLQTDHLPSDTQ